MNIIPDFDEFPQLAFKAGSESDYRFFRLKEPHLVATHDTVSDSEAHHILKLDVFGEPAGLITFLIDRYRHRQSRRNLFARLDLVIVLEKFRGLDIANCATQGGLLFVLSLYTKQLYSISCLAGHEGMAHILDNLGFKILAQDKNCQRYEYHVDRTSEEILFGQLRESLPEALKLLNYRSRQRKGELKRK